MLLTLCSFSQTTESRAAESRKCAGASTASASWHRLDTGPFSILVPPQWEFHQLAGVDSYLGEFVGDGMLKFDFGVYSNGYSKKDKKSGHVITKKLIAGRTAKLVQPETPGRGITAVYFSKSSGRNALYVWGKDLTAKQQELVLEIFDSIQIGGPLPQSLIPPPPPPPGR